MRLIDADALKRKSELVAPSVYAVPYRAVSVDEIESAPTIEAEPVIHAHWIPKHVINGMTALFDCSNCSVTAHVEFMSDRCWFKRCHNCGAWMDRKEE